MWEIWRHLGILYIRNNHLRPETNFLLQFGDWPIALLENNQVGWSCSGRCAYYLVYRLVLYVLEWLFFSCGVKARFVVTYVRISCLSNIVLCIRHIMVRLLLQVHWSMLLEKLSLVSLLHNLEFIELLILFLFSPRRLERSFQVACTTHVISLRTVHLTSLFGWLKSAPGVSGLRWLLLLTRELLKHGIYIAHLLACLLGTKILVFKEKVLIIELLKLRLTWTVVYGV